MKSWRYLPLLQCLLSVPVRIYYSKAWGKAFLIFFVVVVLANWSYVFVVVVFVQ